MTSSFLNSRGNCLWSPPPFWRPWRPGGVSLQFSTTKTCIYSVTCRMENVAWWKSLLTGVLRLKVTACCPRPWIQTSGKLVTAWSTITTSGHCEDNTDGVTVVYSDRSQVSYCFDTCTDRGVSVCSCPTLAPVVFKIHVWFTVRTSILSCVLNL